MREKHPTVAIERLGQGDPVVLIHGLATNRHIWDATAAGLADTHRVITLDVPGFGESPPAGDGFDLDEVARTIADALEERTYDLVGHSLGAGIAITIAAQRPEAVRSLILVAPAGLRTLPSLAATALTRTSDALLATRRKLAPLTDLRWGRRLLLGFAAADGAAVPPTQARMLVQASAGARRTAAALHTITRADLTQTLARTTMPLGVIWGERDRTVRPEVAEVVRAARPDAAIITIPDAGHVLMVERPERFAAALEELLQTNMQQPLARGALT